MKTRKRKTEELFSHNRSTIGMGLGFDNRKLLTVHPQQILRQ
jgi:hypothetical protein